MHAQSVASLTGAVAAVLVQLEAEHAIPADCKFYCPHLECSAVMVVNKAEPGITTPCVACQSIALSVFGLDLCCPVLTNHLWLQFVDPLPLSEYLLMTHDVSPACMTRWEKKLHGSMPGTITTWGITSIVAR